MGMFDGIFGKRQVEAAPEGKLEKEMDNVDNNPVQESADYYIIRVNIGPEGNTKPVTRAMAPDKIIFTNLSALSKNPEKANEVVKVLKGMVGKHGGSIAMVSPELLVITPPKVGIRREKQAEEEKKE
ncbi:cell division protein SepF [Candidatus Micrarchaeota archaeon]|nr:cell division protein SepF [Candidatus Micrarchaeota archaeon]